MTVRLAALAFATAISAASASGSPGVKASISSSGLSYVMSVALPMIQKKMASVTIPDTDTKKGKVKVSISRGTCHLTSIGAGTLRPAAGQGLTGSIRGISVSCSAHVKAKLDIWPHPSCSFDMDGSVGSGSASLLIGVDNRGGHPVLSAKSVDVGVKGFKIKFHGSICGFVANLIKSVAELFFKHKVEHLIESEVDKVLTSFISDDANKIIDSIPLVIPLPFKAPFDIADIEFGLTDAPAFETGYIGIDLAGGIVNAKTKTPAPFPAPSIPAFSNSSSEHFLQLFLSPYVIESAVWTYQQAGLVNYTVKHSVIPASFPVQLNTSALALVAPGIAEQFPNEWVDLRLAMPEGLKATVDVTPAKGVSVAVPLHLEFNPISGSGATQNAFTLGCNFTGAMALRAETNSTTGYPMIQGDLSYLDCPLSLVSSNVGPVSSELAKGLVDFVLHDAITPLVNVLLKTGIPIPSLAGVTLRDVRIINGNGYVLLATDFTYRPTLEQELAIYGRNSHGSTLATSLRGGAQLLPSASRVLD